MGVGLDWRCGRLLVHRACIWGAQVWLLGASGAYCAPLWAESIPICRPVFVPAERALWLSAHCTLAAVPPARPARHVFRPGPFELAQDWTRQLGGPTDTADVLVGRGWPRKQAAWIERRGLLLRPPLRAPPLKFNILLSKGLF